MLFNRQQDLDLTIPDEVIIYFIQTNYCNTYREFNNNRANKKLKTPALKSLAELVNTLATTGVTKFNIVIYNVRSLDDDTYNNRQVVDVIKSSIFAPIVHRRKIDYSIIESTVERNIDDIRESTLPKFFIATNYLTLLHKEHLNKTINYLLATSITDNSYFIGTGNEPFIIKGKPEGNFTNFLTVIKTFFDTPLATLDLMNVSIIPRAYKYYQYLAMLRIDTIVNTDDTNIYKTNINYWLKHELVISLAVNMLVKPDKFFSGQVVIIKKILDDFFNYTTTTLDMNPKAAINNITTMKHTLAKMIEENQ